MTTRQPESALMNLYWIGRWRVVMWKRDVAKAERLLELVRPQSFGLARAVETMLSIIATKIVPKEILVELDQRGAIGRALRRRAFFRQLKAEVLAYVGDAEAMLLALEEAEEAGLFDITWLDRCPLFEEYRGATRFQAVRAKVAERAAEVIGALGL
jgi:serine/threonine-protein kinase